MSDLGGGGERRSVIRRIKPKKPKEEDVPDYLRNVAPSGDMPLLRRLSEKGELPARDSTSTDTPERRRQREREEARHRKIRRMGRDYARGGQVVKGSELKEGG